MPLSNSYVQVYGQLPEVFKRIADGQAPEKFTRQYLKDLGFGSSTFRALIPLLKTLHFLTEDGTPTSRYHEYRNTARSRQIMAEALREAYGDLFTIKAKPTEADRALIEGKFKSAHNVSPNLAKLMANTFYALLDLADMDAALSFPLLESAPAEPEEPLLAHDAGILKNRKEEPPPHGPSRPTFHYNIQIHLPANGAEETYLNIFNAVRKTFQ